MAKPTIASATAIHPALADLRLMICDLRARPAKTNHNHKSQFAHHRSTSPLVEHLVDPCNRRFLKSRTGDVAVMLAMGAQVDPLCGVGNRHFLIVKRLRLIPE